MTSHDQSCSVVSSHDQSWLVVLSRVQSWPIMSSRVQSCPVMTSRVQSWFAVMTGHDWSRLVVTGHDWTRLDTTAHDWSWPVNGNTGRVVPNRHNSRCAWRRKAVTQTSDVKFYDIQDVFLPSYHEIQKKTVLKIWYSNHFWQLYSKHAIQKTQKLLVFGSKNQFWKSVRKISSENHQKSPKICFWKSLNYSFTRHNGRSAERRKALILPCDINNHRTCRLVSRHGWNIHIKKYLRLKTIFGWNFMWWNIHRWK